MKKVYTVVLEVTDDCDPKPLTKQEIMDLVIDVEGNRKPRPAGAKVEPISIVEMPV